MLSYEIDALVADRFKASWERMVLLAAIKRAEYENRVLPETILRAVNEHWLLNLHSIQMAYPSDAA